MSNMETIKAFIAKWNSRDIDGISALLAEDVFYHNIPLEPMQGRDQLRAAFGPMIASYSGIEWRLHHIAEGSDGVVLTERTDAFIRDGKSVSVRVMGAFEVRRGLIVVWRDYFDLKQWQSQLNADDAGQ